MIKGLHHNAYRCRDSEETRRFYEDFLGLPLAGTLEIHETKTGRQVSVLHTFYQMGDGSFLAFFEAPDMPFEFRAQHDYDLHIALEVDAANALGHVRERKGARHRDARDFRSRLRSLDLFPRSQRLRDRADCEDRGARGGDGSNKERRPGEARAVATREDRARARLTHTVRPGSRVLCGLRSVGEIRDTETAAALRRLGPVAPRAAGAVLAASRR